MIALFCIFAFITTSSAEIWVPLGDYEYSYDESQQIAFLGPDDALAACDYLGAELAVVNSKSINDLISDLGFHQYTLIGLVRNGPDDNSFNWIDGTPVTDGRGYTNWNTGKGEPGDERNNTEQCVIMGWNGEWEDTNCGGYKKWVCQRKNEKTKTTEDITATTTTTKIITSNIITKTAEEESSITATNTATKQEDATASTEVKTSLVTSSSSSSSTISCLDKTILIVLVGLNSFWILVVLIAIAVLCRIYTARKKIFDNKTDATMNSNPPENTSLNLPEENPIGEYIEANFVQENGNQTNPQEKDHVTIDYHEGRNCSIKRTYLNHPVIADEHVYAQELTSSSIPLESGSSESYDHQLNSGYLNVKCKISEPTFHTYEC